MQHLRSTILVVSILIAIAATSGCHSPAFYAQRHSAMEAERRQNLLRQYPPGKTTRTAVLARWIGPPRTTALRPDAGWTACENKEMRERVLASETRTGMKVSRCDHFTGAAGISGGLLSAWFYYGPDDAMLDGDNPYQSD